MSQPSVQAPPISPTGLFTNGLRLYIPFFFLCLYSILLLSAGISIFCTLPGTPSQKCHCPCSLPKYSAVFVLEASRYSPILPTRFCGSRSAQMAILLVFTGAGKLHAKVLLCILLYISIYKNMTFVMSEHDFYHILCSTCYIFLLRIQEVRATLGSAPERLSVTGNRSLNDTYKSLGCLWSASRLLFLNDFWFQAKKPGHVSFAKLARLKYVIEYKVASWY